MQQLYRSLNPGTRTSKSESLVFRTLQNKDPSARSPIKALRKGSGDSDSKFRLQVCDSQGKKLPPGESLLLENRSRRNIQRHFKKNQNIESKSFREMGNRKTTKSNPKASAKRI